MATLLPCIRCPCSLPPRSSSRSGPPAPTRRSSVEPRGCRILQAYVSTLGCRSNPHLYLSSAWQLQMPRGPGPTKDRNRGAEPVGRNYVWPRLSRGVVTNRPSRCMWTNRLQNSSMQVSPPLSRSSCRHGYIFCGSSLVCSDTLIRRTGDRYGVRSATSGREVDPRNGCK